MKISEIINLLNEHKYVTILTPNFYERKLLYDKFILHIKDAIIIDKHTIQIKDSYITFVIPDNFNSINVESLFIIEFADQIPHHILNNALSDDVMFVREIV